MNNALISSVAWFIIQGINRSCRITVINPEYSNTPPVTFSFWHGEQFPLYYQQRNRRIAIMTSLSKDGEMQSAILTRLGYQCIRGSSSKRGDRALVEMIRAIKKGFTIAFAVDGPKGPPHQIKPGVVYLAQKTGHPIVPLGSWASRRFIFSRAWDQYMIPMPFSRVVIAYAPPVHCPETKTLEENMDIVQKHMDTLSAFTHTSFWARDVREYLKNHPRPKILIVQPSRIGDIVFTLPLLKDLRAAYPQAWIGWFVDERCAALIEDNPLLDEVIVFDRRKVSLRYFLKLWRTLHDKSIDVSIDVHGLFKSAFMVMLAGARWRLASASTYGMKELSWVISRCIHPDKPHAHCVERHRAVGRYLGTPDTHVNYPLILSPKALSSVKQKLEHWGVRPDERVVVFHIGGGWRSRRWDARRYAVLADRITALKGIRVMVVGGKEGGSKEDEPHRIFFESVKTPVINAVDALTLPELAALYKQTALFVGNEAGPMHIAVASGIPVMALLGPTNHLRTGPYGEKAVIIRHQLECQPCRNRNCTHKTCMEQITVDEVFTAVQHQLAQHKNTGATYENIGH